MNIIYNRDPRITKPLEDILTEPIIIRVGEICESSAKDFSENVTKAHLNGQSFIPVIIDSYGGDVYSLMSMLSAVENSKIPVCTICTGKAMSAGSILLSSGHPGARFIDPNATVMVHEISSGTWGQLSELTNCVNEANRLNELIYRKMADYCGHKNKKYFIELLKKHNNINLFMNCLEAKNHKIIDEIGVPDIQINIGVNMELVFKKQTKKSKKSKSNKGKEKKN